MYKITALSFVFAVFMISTSPLTFAESDQDKLSFASSLEETLGHFWALEQNLDEKNAELALVHATHPVAELYDSMKPTLQASDPALDSEVQTILMNLGQKATTTVSRDQAQQAIDDAKEVVSIARQTVVGDYLSNSIDTKLLLMKILLETSIAEYHEAVSDGVIGEMAEFQDGSAFVWRSQQIFDEIKSDLPEHEVEETEELYTDLWDAYDNRADPTDVETIAGGIIHEIDEILGLEGEGTDLIDYVDTIKSMLTQAKTEYANGNTDLALSLATKAYLDNFEFLEAPLVQAGQQELMEKVETNMRIELRDMIKNGAPSSEVNQKIDAIISDMDIVQVSVPEFGTVAMMILAVAIISIVAVTAKTKMIPRF